MLRVLFQSFIPKEIQIEKRGTNASLSRLRGVHYHVTGMLQHVYFGLENTAG